MKKNLMVVGLLFGVLFSLIGCDSGRDDIPTPPELVLEFDSDGDYDLSQYLYPESNSTNMYEQNVYTNTDGKREYASLDANRTFYNMKYIVGQDSTQEILRLNSIEIKSRTYKEQEYRILLNDWNDEQNITIARYVDSADLVIDHTNIINEDGNEKETGMRCIVSEYQGSDIPYDDVLLLSCTMYENYESISIGEKFETKKAGSKKIYISKRIGVVRSIEDVCENRYFKGDSFYKECVKTVVDITQSITQ